MYIQSLTETTVHNALRVKQMSKTPEDQVIVTLFIKEHANINKTQLKVLKAQTSKVVKVATVDKDKEIEDRPVKQG